MKTSTSLGGTDSQHGPQPEADKVKSDSGTSMLFSFVTAKKKKSQTRRRAPAGEYSESGMSALSEVLLLANLPSVACYE